MELQDIPTHPIEPWMFPETQEIRSHAPGNLVALIEAGVLENVSALSDLQPDQLSVLGAGEVSAGYLLKNNGQSAIVKFRYKGLEAEAEALRFWRDHGIPAPKVMASGVVPQTGADSLRPTKYIVEEVIVEEGGEMSPIGYEFIRNNPDQASVMGSRAGKILANIHKYTVDGGFGGFSDAWENLGRNYDNFADFLVGFVRFYEGVLAGEGLSPDYIDSISEAIKKVRFAEKPVYVHGDYGAHNIVVRDNDPEDLTVIDPNSLLADPYWDLATFIDRLNIKKLKAEDNPDEEGFAKEYMDHKVFSEPLLDTYQRETGEPIDEKRMDAVRFAKLLYKIANSQRREINRDPAAKSIRSLGKNEKRVVMELGYSRQILLDLAAKITATPIASTE